MSMAHGWMRHLPEVGETITADCDYAADKIARLYDALASAREEYAYEVKRAEARTARLWTEAEIDAARKAHGRR